MNLTASHTSVRVIASVFLAAGVALVMWSAIKALQAASFQRQSLTMLERVVTAPPGNARPAEGEPIGALEIPRLRLSAAVAEGDSDSVLNTAIGHLPDTPLPWQSGNSAFAAHRDTFFRPLAKVRIGDLVRLSTPHGAFDYQVRETLVVEPDEVSVLDPAPVPSLTLITCYPFTYVGPAPQRFIVRAERVNPSHGGAKARA